MQKALIYDISGLITSRETVSEKHQIVADCNFEGVSLTQPLTADLELYNIPAGLVAIIYNLSSAANFSCSKCLKQFTQNFQIPQIEAQFYFTAQDSENSPDPDSIFFINKETKSIDLTEPLRQEICLQLPLTPVCSDGCLGICSLCGINKNQNSCNCKAENPFKPFAALFDLIPNQNGKTRSSKAKNHQVKK